MSDGISGIIDRLYDGAESRVPMERARGEVIEGVVLVDDELRISFDGFVLVLSDEGQACCEDRYMRTDDDLPYYVGATLLDFAIKDGPTVERDDNVHEQQFFEVKTSVGVFTMASHVEHNGYYGGFALRARIAG